MKSFSEYFIIFLFFVILRRLFSEKEAWEYHSSSSSEEREYLDGFDLSRDDILVPFLMLLISPVCVCVCLKGWLEYV